jgi:hypothetical protein
MSDAATIIAPIDLTACIVDLERTYAAAFYISYSIQEMGNVFPVIRVNDDLFAWRCSLGTGFWQASNAASVALYRVSDLKERIAYQKNLSGEKFLTEWAKTNNPNRSIGLMWGTPKVLRF